MFFGILVLITALAMASTAAWFAIAGIVAVFSGAQLAALVMGCVIETGKVVGVSWLYQNHKEPTVIKYALAPLVIVAMLLTSMGIFGFLSKAHLEQNRAVQTNTAQIERLDQRIAREQSKIKDADSVVAQLDETVQVLINYDKISGPNGARAVREQQQAKRDELSQVIEDAEEKIAELLDQKLELDQQVRAYELEVGPVKYIAELIYSEQATDLDQVVRYVIIAFIFVFDPMAITLLMAANYTLAMRRKESVDQTLPTTNTASYDELFEVMEDPDEDVIEEKFEERSEDELSDSSESSERKVSPNQFDEEEIGDGYQTVAQAFNDFLARRKKRRDRESDRSVDQFDYERLKQHSALRGMENVKDDDDRLRTHKHNRVDLLKD